MKPINISGHAAYQNRVLTQLRKYHPNAAESLPASTWEIMEKFWNLDLKENYLHAILSGFTVGDTPGTGTFYDFQSRLWISGDNNLSPKVHPPKEKPQKPKKKGEKAPPVEKITVKELFEKFELEPPQDMKPCLHLFQIFKELFLLKSHRDRLLDLMKLSIAGDGTPVYTAAQERKKCTCDCLEKGIRDYKCLRIYSQPDCNIGWDSHKQRRPEFREPIPLLHNIFQKFYLD